jgi:hypothetical protein
MTFIASMHVKVARKLHRNSLRYWLLEYLRRQPKGREYKSLILKFIKDRMAVLLLLEVDQHSLCTNFNWFFGGLCFIRVVFGAVAVGCVHMFQLTPISSIRLVPHPLDNSENLIY